MDEYRENASTGSFDIDFAAIGAPLRTAIPYGLLDIESGVFLPATTQRFLGPNKNNEDKSINFDDSQSCPLQPSQKANTVNLSDAANGKEAVSAAASRNGKLVWSLKKKTALRCRLNQLKLAKAQMDTTKTPKTMNTVTRDSESILPIEKHIHISDILTI